MTTKQAGHVYNCRRDDVTFWREQTRAAHINLLEAEDAWTEEKIFECIYNFAFANDLQIRNSNKEFVSIITLPDHIAQLASKIMKIL